MKRFLLLAAVMFISLGANAQSGAKIEFKTDTIDYGTTNKDDDNGLRVFEFTNTGDAPLIITDVKSSCGCTVPSKPTDPIQPGKTGTIEVKYNMHTGPIRKTITVMSNAANVPDGVVALKIKGEVIEKEKVNILEKKKSLVNQ
ncbi:DUF1573 domain-containing protein [Flavobacterium rhizosphaerae]|uniref:DUF1573 domain-containing protein n=1 Tax=Flavobacterium rhizosphaerae TaxID=3163298 RepID=A0ABW8YYT7_9FLAO